MTATQWNFDATDGQLSIRTGVTGRAASMGHRLTIAVGGWHATLGWAQGRPADLEVTVQVDSLDVVSGEGGLKGLSSPEKALARTNALSVLRADKFPEIRFRSTGIEQTDGGYRIAGTLEIAGKSHPQLVDLSVEDAVGQWRMSSETEVRHSDFGLKPYSMFFGGMKVADAVTVAFTAQRDKES